MSNTVISIEHLTKQYDLGVIGTGTLSRDLERWWARVRHHPDPYTKIGHEDTFNRIGESILALDDVSFTVRQGEALGIIGRNGAGKSTLLKILSRVTAPSSGKVKIKGRIGSLLEVGTGFHPELTGRENVFLNGAILGMKKDEVQRKFDEIVDFSGVEKFIDTPVKRYSSGMYVRLAFAVAAHLDPEILIVDEVLAVGDAEFQKKCLGKMGDVASHGRTILFVSHNMSAINNLCDRTIILNSGRICYIGKTDQAIQEYQNTINIRGTQDLRNRIDREGDGAIRITKVSLFDSDDHPLDVAISGKTLRINLEYEVYKKLSLVDFAIGFRTNLGEPLFICSTSHLSEKIEILPGHGKISCELHSLPLASGVYLLNLAAYRGNYNYDWIKQAYKLEVQTIDFFGNGSDVSVGHSPFLVKSNWYKG